MNIFKCITIGAFALLTGQTVEAALEISRPDISKRSISQEHKACCKLFGSIKEILLNTSRTINELGPAAQAELKRQSSTMCGLKESLQGDFRQAKELYSAGQDDAVRLLLISIERKRNALDRMKINFVHTSEGFLHAAVFRQKRRKEPTFFEQAQEIMKNQQKDFMAFSQGIKSGLRMLGVVFYPTIGISIDISNYLKTADISPAERACLQELAFSYDRTERHLENTKRVMAHKFFYGIPPLLDKNHENIDNLGLHFKAYVDFKLQSSSEKNA